ncbi:IS66 family insertion sequence element accessory protein TnpB [Lachnospiraceae bacterium MD308]|nr:IS66 family insertion sequence element accessory protein TnpB [Lachnospiraceae bacterium MD308]
MLDFSGNTTVYLACGVTDLRKSYTGLAAIIKLKFHLDPYSRCMFAFCNRRRTLIKILQWDGSGFWILMKPSEVTAEEWTYVNTLDKKSRKIMLLFLVPHPPFAVVSNNQ